MSTTLDIIIVRVKSGKIFCRPELYFKEVVRDNDVMSLYGFLF